MEILSVESSSNATIQGAILIETTSGGSLLKDELYGRGTPSDEERNLVKDLNTSETPPSSQKPSRRILPRRAHRGKRAGTLSGGNLTDAAIILPRGRYHSSRKVAGRTERISLKAASADGDYPRRSR